MPAAIQWFLILTGVAVCAILAVFIKRQYSRLQHYRDMEQQLQDRMDNHRTRAIESIRILARTMLAGQVELSEGCIRVKVLLDSVAPELHQDERFSIFNQLYDETLHMPTHEARREVDKRFLFKLDRQRWQLENEHKEAILAASQALLDHTF